MTDEPVAFPLLGRCLCGAVRFAVHAPPVSAGYCHCRNCQHRAGVAASLNVKLEPGSFELLAGADRVAGFAPEGGSTKFFCTACGSHVFAQKRDADQPSHVRMGAFEGDPGVRPSYRAWVSSAAPWEPIPDDGLPRYPQAP
jgi:hypothetical protein